METTTLKGISVPLLTPLTPGMEPDEAGLRRLVGHVLSGGVDSVFVMGTTGEFQYLSHDQQLACISVVVEEVAGRVPVLAGVTGLSIEETVRNLTRLERLKPQPDAVVVAPLVYHSNRKMPQHLQRLSEVSMFPILLYNNMAIVERRWKRKDMVPELIQRVSGRKKIIGLKDSSNNMDYFRDLLRRCAGEQFVMFQAGEKLILKSMDCGACGAVAGTANVLPDLFKRLHDAWLAGDRDDAGSCQGLIPRIASCYSSGAVIPAILKEWLRRRGLLTCAAAFGAPPQDMDRIQERLAELTDAGM